MLTVMCRALLQHLRLLISDTLQAGQELEKQLKTVRMQRSYVRISGAGRFPIHAARHLNARITAGIEDVSQVPL